MSLADIFRFGAYGQQPPQAPQQQPPPRQSRLVELMQSLAQEQGAPIPQTYRELPREDRRRSQSQSILALAAALGAAPQGQIGSALAEAGWADSQIREQTLRQHQERARQANTDRRGGIADQIELERAIQGERAREEEQQRQQLARERLSQLGAAVRAQLPPDDPRVAQAGTYEATEDVKGMGTLLGSIREEQAGRAEQAALAERYGVDPGDPIALEVAEQQALKSRGLGQYYRAPERPREGSLQVAEDGTYVLIDQISGRATPTGVRAAQQGGASRQDKEADDDFKAAVRLAEQKRQEVFDTWQQQLAAPQTWGSADQPPPRPQFNLEGEVAAHYEVLKRVRSSRRPAPLVNPLEGRPEEAPTSFTGPGKGKPQQPLFTADDVIRLIPKGMVVSPEVRQAIDEDLRANKKPHEILLEILRENGMT